MFPVIINIPPTSIKPFKDYLAKRLLLRGKRPHQVVTKITLKKASSSDGITYSQCVFAKAGDLSPEIMKSLEPSIALTKELMSIQAPPPVMEAEPQATAQEAQTTAQEAQFGSKVVTAADVEIPQFEEVKD